MTATLRLDLHYKVKGYAAVMRIGELADVAGVATQTIRFYERKGLLPQPRRESNSYRDYDPATLVRLEFIRTAQTAGLTLTEIGSIIDLRDDGTAPCAHVHSLLLAKLHEVHARQRELAALETELGNLIGRSDRLDPAACPDTQICHIIQTSP